MFRIGFDVDFLSSLVEDLNYSFLLIYIHLFLLEILGKVLLNFGPCYSPLPQCDFPNEGSNIDPSTHPVLHLSLLPSMPNSHSSRWYIEECLLYLKRVHLSSLVNGMGTKILGRTDFIIKCHKRRLWYLIGPWIQLLKGDPSLIN